MKVGFYGHIRQYHNLKDEIEKNIQEVLESGKYVQGPMLSKYEKELSEYFGSKYAIGVNSGTDAIWLSLLALGIGKGDECITTTNTFFATAEAIWITGATAVFVDSDPQTHCIDPSKIEAAITPKTKVLIPVHLYGQCADMKSIWEIAKKHNLLVIEDNAQGIDGRGKDFIQGEKSNAVTISFIAQKNLGTFGDAGAVLTDDEEINNTVRKLRNHGSNKRSHHSPGFNSRLDDLHAGVLSTKLKHITEWTNTRIEIARKYSDSLKDAKNIILPYTNPGYRHVFHLYVIHTKDPNDRDDLLKHLNDNQIDAKTHYPIAIHQQEGYPWNKEARIVGRLENSEWNAARCISLPMYPELLAEEINYVIDKVLEWDNSKS
ncbi:MAG: DegT/DnrJ/EryC1/StrS family aminotransferase [Promethearchaeota archaeon]